MKQRIAVHLSIVTLLSAFLGVPVLGASDQRPVHLDTVKTMLADKLERWRGPGLSAAIVSDRRLLWSHGFGLADVEQRVPVRPTTVFRIASISKPITAVAVLQLVERGKLDLDAPIQRYCPAFPAKPWPVTSRQLLAHLGGIRSYQSNEEFYSTRHYTDLRGPLALFKDDPLVHEPGTKFLYTTYGYNLLGCVIEGAAGMRYVDYMREEIFEPAGMRHARPDDVYAIIPNRARAYRRAPTGELQNAPLADTSNKIPGGGFCTTVEDLARFAVAIQTGELLAPTTTALMFKPQSTHDGQEIAYGLGWVVETRNGPTEAWHLGGGQGVSTILYMRPEEGLAVILLSNINGLATPSEGAPILEVARQIAGLVAPPQALLSKGKEHSR